MKETTKRRLPMIVPIVIIVSCILSVAGGIGGYWHYSHTKNKAPDQADREFGNAYWRWFDHDSGIYGRHAQEVLELRCGYSTIRSVQKREARRMIRQGSGKEEVLQACDNAKRNLDKQERAYKDMQNELSTMDEVIQNLNEKAQKLSTKEKRKRALKIASLAREAIDADNKCISLEMDALLIDRKINELYASFANGCVGGREWQISESSFDESFGNYQSESIRLGEAANEQLDKISQAGDQISNEWEKLGLDPPFHCRATADLKR